MRCYSAARCRQRRTVDALVHAGVLPAEVLRAIVAVIACSHSLPSVQIVQRASASKLCRLACTTRTAMWWQEL